MTATEYLILELMQVMYEMAQEEEQDRRQLYQRRYEELLQHKKLTISSLIL